MEGIEYEKKVMYLISACMQWVRQRISNISSAYLLTNQRKIQNMIN